MPGPKANPRTTTKPVAALLCGLVAAVLWSAPAAQAQIGPAGQMGQSGQIGMPGGRTGPPPGGVRPGGGRPGVSRPHSGTPFFHNPFGFPLAYLYDPYLYWNSDQPDDNRQPAPAPAPVVVVQQPSAPAPEPPPPEPLMLELRGDHWVRVTGSDQVGSEGVVVAQPAAESPAPAKLPPTVLVYRDGHRAEVESYTIVGPVLYIRTDYWTTGSWTEAVPIAQLDLPATLKANQERGLKFNLPSGPHEVIVRP